MIEHLFYTDNLFILPKSDLKKIINDSENINLKDLLLTISLYSSKFNESINNITYSFIVRLSNETEKDIYRINSEIQTQRKSKSSSIDSISDRKRSFKRFFFYKDIY